MGPEVNHSGFMEENKKRQWKGNVGNVGRVFDLKLLKCRVVREMARDWNIGFACWRPGLNPQHCTVPK